MVPTYFASSIYAQISKMDYYCVGRACVYDNSKLFWNPRPEIACLYTISKLVWNPTPQNHRAHIETQS